MELAAGVASVDISARRDATTGTPLLGAPRWRMARATGRPNRRASDAKDMVVLCSLRRVVCCEHAGVACHVKCSGRLRVSDVH